MKNTIKADIAAELYKALQSLGAKSDLLTIVRSYGDSGPDEWVLEALRKWNAANHPDPDSLRTDQLNATNDE
jgi:hypothetical protein